MPGIFGDKIARNFILQVIAKDRKEETTNPRRPEPTQVGSIFFATMGNFEGLFYMFLCVCFFRIHSIFYFFRVKIFAERGDFRAILRRVRSGKNYVCVDALESSTVTMVAF